MTLFHANGAPRFGRVMLSAGGDGSGGGSGAGDGKEGDGKDGDGKDGKDGDGKDGKEGDGKEGDGSGGTLTLSEKELNRRIAAARRQAEAEAATKHKDAIEKARLYDEDQEKRKDETQKAIDKAVSDKQKELQASFEAEKAAIVANTNARLLEAEVRQHAASNNFLDPDYVWFLAQPELEEGGALSVDEDGKVSGVEEWVEKLAKDKPALVKAGDGNHLPNPPRGGGNGDGDAQKEMRQQARQTVWGASRRTR